MLRELLLAMIACACLASAGCASNEPPPPPQTIPQLDMAHVTAVQARLKGDGELAGEVIKVSAKGDTVVLEGSVQTAEEKERAEKFARSVKGVSNVENKLEVKPNNGANPGP